jgi:hypothetical protein
MFSSFNLPVNPISSTWPSWAEDGKLPRKVNQVGAEDENEGQQKGQQIQKLW